MTSAQAWNQMTPRDGAVGEWFTSSIRDSDFWTVAGFAGRVHPAYAVVYDVPSEEFDDDPRLGEVYERLRTVLARHTLSTRFFGALWEGCGYFGGGYRSVGPLSPDDPGPPGPGWEAEPSEFAEAADNAQRLYLPQREHVVFEAVIEQLDHVPIGRDGLLREVPSLFWPEDQDWLTAHDIDLWVTFVAGTEALIADVLDDDRLRAERVQASERIKDAWFPVD